MNIFKKAWRAIDGRKTIAGVIVTGGGLLMLLNPVTAPAAEKVLMIGVTAFIGGITHKGIKHYKKKKSEENFNSKTGEWIMYNVKETQEFIAFIMSLIETMVKAIKERWNWMQVLTNLFQPFMKLGDAIRGISEIPDEIEDMEDFELNEYLRPEIQKFDVEDEDVENIVEEAAELVLRFWRLILKILAALSKNDEVLAEKVDALNARIQKMK